LVAISLLNLLEFAMQEHVLLVEKFILDKMGLCFKETDEWEAWQKIKVELAQQTTNKQSTQSTGYECGCECQCACLSR
jgi:hypothetical protein